MGSDSDKQLGTSLNSSLLKIIVEQRDLFSGLKCVEVEID